MDPTLVISIDRTGMEGAPAPLSFYGAPSADELGITEFSEPTLEPQNIYATKFDDEDGQDVRGASWLNTVIAWDFVTDAASNEQESRNLLAEVRAAVARIEFEVTVTVHDADPEVWLVQGYGSLRPAGGRTRANLVDSNPVWQLSLPVKPIRSVA